MLITQFLDYYVLRTRKELRNMYAKLDLPKGNLLNMIGKDDRVRFREFKKFFRVTPTDSRHNLEGYIKHLNNPMNIQDSLILNFVVNFSKLEGTETHVGNLHLNLNDIIFNPSTENIELKFVFANPNDSSLKQFNGERIFKKIIDAGFPSNYKLTRRALEDKKLTRLGSIKTGQNIFDDVYKTFKITITDFNGKEYILSYKTEIALELKKFYNNSDILDLIVIKDFISLTFKDYSTLIEKYEQFHTFACIGLIDDINTEMDEMFKDLKTFHADQVLPLIGEEESFEEDDILEDEDE